VRRATVAFVLLIAAGGAANAKPAKRRAPAHHAAPSHAPVPVHTQEHAVTPAPSIADSTSAGDGTGDGAEGSGGGETKAGGKTLKTKTYTFGAMDVEGKLKTPQLLYFLNRVQLELDMSAPDKRSFMKELGQSADDKSL
jgi:hypothetical protein